MRFATASHPPCVRSGSPSLLWTLIMARNVGIALCVVSVARSLRVTFFPASLYHGSLKYHCGSYPRASVGNSEYELVLGLTFHQISGSCVALLIPLRSVGLTRLLDSWSLSYPADGSGRTIRSCSVPSECISVLYRSLSVIISHTNKVELKNKK